MAVRKTVTVTLGLDVEEEGLFSGSYRRINPSVQNVSRLFCLEPFLERGVKPTLFCAWPVFQDKNARKILDQLRSRRALEIGAHLHYWNTPPLAEGPDPNVAPIYYKTASARVEPAILKAKLLKLMAAASDFNAEPVVSFRMGRWDIHRVHWPLLMSCGIKCDASIRPLHSGRQAGAPDHFDAPQDPYRLLNRYGSIFEIPLTVTSWTPFFRVWRRKNFLAALVKPNFKSWGALPLLAVEHPLPLLKLTTLLHIAAGGKNLSLTWHSSEMMPGGAPHMPDSASVSKFLAKMDAYFDWLEKKFNAQYETMNSLRQRMEHFTFIAPEAPGDWSFPPEDIFSESGSRLAFL